MEKLRDSTLVFLIKRNGRDVSEICLAMKKRGFGAGRWNGAGGKVEAGESIEEAAKRETKEEIGVELMLMNKVAELTFHFPHRPDWDQLVHVHFSEEWQGEPLESEEMRPEWFNVEKIPFREMWLDDEFWLPSVLSGEYLRATFFFGEGDAIIKKTVKKVMSL